MKKQNNKKQPKVVIIDADSWVGLYVDGKLKLQDNSLDITYVLKELGIECSTIVLHQGWDSLTRQYYIDGCFPDNFSDLKEVIKESKKMEKE
jgi:hypothetical protein